MDVKKIFVAAMLTTMAGILISSLHGMAQDVIRINVHQVEQDNLIRENHSRSKRIFEQLRLIRKENNIRYQNIYKELLEIHKKGK